MLERLNTILNCIIGSFIGVFIGYSIYIYFDYINYYDLYEMQPATWYTNIQIYGLIVTLFIIIAVIIKLLIKRKCEVLRYLLIILRISLWHDHYKTGRVYS